MHNPHADGPGEDAPAGGFFGEGRSGALLDDAALSASAAYGARLTGPALFAETSVPEPDSGRPPSLPIILISAACGIAGGVLGLYISYEVLSWGVALSAGAATLGLLFGLGGSGAALSAVTGERGAPVNMAFSCSLIVLVILFMAMCAVVGAAVATLLVAV